MDIGHIDTPWRGLFELLSDLSLQEDSDAMLETFMNELGDIIPVDRGAALHEFRSSFPHCIRWPQYAEGRINDFNSHFNRCCPVDYNWKHRIFGPVSWQNYSDSEYDADFMRPLGLHHSIGIGWEDTVRKKEMVLVIHRSRAGKAFSSRDLQNLLHIQPLFSRIYNLTKKGELRDREVLSPAESASGVNPLSPREAEVASLLTRRISMRVIAGRLGISPRTVERHAFHIYQKLNVSNRKELIEVLLHTETSKPADRAFSSHSPRSGPGI